MRPRDRAIPISRLPDTSRAATEAQIAKKEALGQSGVDKREMLRIDAKTPRPGIGAQTAGAFAPERLGFWCSEAARCSRPVGKASASRHQRRVRRRRSRHESCGAWPQGDPQYP